MPNPNDKQTHTKSPLTLGWKAYSRDTYSSKTYSRALEQVSALKADEPTLLGAVLPKSKYRPAPPPGVLAKLEGADAMAPLPDPRNKPDEKPRPRFVNKLKPDGFR